MLCEKCNKNYATTVIRQNINGVQSEVHLCDECSKMYNEYFENGYSKMFSDFGFGIGSVLGSILGQDFLSENLLSSKDEPKCPMCNTTLNEIKNSGNVGCSNCYETFREQLMPLINRIHGKTVHSGRIPASAEGKVSLKNRLADAEKQLKIAIENQEFEKAAKLRDEINELKKEI